MTDNPFIIAALKRKLVQRSTKPIYRGNFALTTAVTELRQFESCTETMQRAAASMPDAWYIHFKTETETPADTVRLIPTILQSFNRTRTLRRARVSGIRLCNLFTAADGDWYYCSDMVVSCSFDAMAIASALADYAHIGQIVTVSYKIPTNVKRGGIDAVMRFIDRKIDNFWGHSKLARHSVLVTCDRRRTYSDYVYIEFEPKTLSALALVHYLIRSDVDLHSILIGRNNRLAIARTPLWDRRDYTYYQPDKVCQYNFRYRHAAAFGIYYNNPDFPIY